MESCEDAKMEKIEVPEITPFLKKQADEENMKLDMEEYVNATRMVVRNTYKKYLENKLIDHPEMVLNTKRFLEAVEFNKAYEDKDVYDSPFVWLTINPPEEVNKNEFIDKVFSSLEKKWIDNWMLVFEQRSEVVPWKGLHVHILIRKQKKRPSEVKREFYNTFKKLVPNQRAFYYKFVDENAAAQKVQYMKGQKVKEKQAKLQIDAIMRKELELDESYVKEVDLEPGV